MSEKRCDTCEFWDSDPNLQEWEPAKAGFAYCTAMRERWRIMDEASSSYAATTDAEEELFIEKRVDALRNARVYVQDGSEYKAEVFTAPDFYCALHEPKQPEALASDQTPIS